MLWTSLPSVPTSVDGGAPRAGGRGESGGGHKNGCQVTSRLAASQVFFAWVRWAAQLASCASDSERIFGF